MSVVGESTRPDCLPEGALQSICYVSTHSLLVVMLEGPLVMLETGWSSTLYNETYHAGMVPLSLVEMLPIASCATHHIDCMV